MSEFAGRAAAAGTRLLVLPEGSLVRFLDDPAAAVRCAQPVDGEFGTAVVDASRRHGIAVAAGMFTPHEGRARNTLLVADRGELVAVYHKVHLYDAFAYLESDLVEPGTETPPVVEIDGVPIGFATCYDLRFPELFRVLVDRGAQVLAVASAWVAGPLKEEHWLTLLRARAIENTSYVVAADQSGRKGIGRSAAFDPMGLPLLDLGTADGVHRRRRRVAGPDRRGAAHAARAAAPPVPGRRATRLSWALSGRVLRVSPSRARCRRRR